jgi:purine-nucleoside phosphorylase
MFNQIKIAADYLKVQTNNFNPELGIILGTGLDGLVKDIDVDYEIDYENIPGFSNSTAESHKGRLIFGSIGGKKATVMQGRLHYYEGYTLKEVAFPVQVMKVLGIETLFVSNASGGINSKFKKGDLMILKDHINHFPGNPLTGKNIDELGPKFVDMCEPYNKSLILKAEAIACEFGFKIQTGVYVGLPGPMLETPAEYNYLRIIGADAVGMSTVPEIIAAKHAGLKCFACSIITDICYGEIKPVEIKEIISTARNAEPNLTNLFKELINQL